MDALTVEYKSDTGLYIIRISDKRYYYGNGKDINAVGISANQFLRFNPYLDYVKPDNLAVPTAIRGWIEKNVR